MTQRAGRACRSIWDRRGLRWLAALGAAAVVAVTLGAFRVPFAAACVPNLRNTALPVMSPTGHVSSGVARSLSTTGGSWTDGCGHTPTLTYQWFQQGLPGGQAAKAISGAVYSVYQTKTTDLGTFTVVVTAHTADDSLPKTATGYLTVDAPTANNSSAWSGWIAGSPNHQADYWNQVTGTFTQPDKTYSCSAFSYQTNAEVVGIGGYNTGNLIEAGTQVTSVPYPYRQGPTVAFWEVAGTSSNLSDQWNYTGGGSGQILPRAGDTVTITVSYDPATSTATFTIVDTHPDHTSDSGSASASVIQPDGTSAYDGTTAEWIDEYPDGVWGYDPANGNAWGWFIPLQRGTTLSNTTLNNFGQMNWTGMRLTHGSTATTPGANDPSHTGLANISNGAITSVMATPTAEGTDTLTDTWGSCGP